MNIKQSTLAAAVAAALALGASGQASAFVYAASGLTIDNLAVVISPNGGTVSVNRFDFNQSDLATLNGSTSASSASCGGTPGVPGPSTNNCTAANMDAAAVNASGSTATRTNNQSLGGEFQFLGPSSTPTFTGDYSNADSQIVTAELVNLGSPTLTHNIAESLLNSGTSAAANSQIQSITGFTITFTVSGGPADFTLNFDADPDLAAAIIAELNGTFSAQANINASITLQNNTGAGFVNWNPQGTGATNDCVAVGVTACTELADTQDLNTNVGTTANNTTALSSWDPNSLNLTHFGLSVTGMAAGTWTLTLNEQKSDQLARTPAVPEPATLALLGIGLAGLGVVARRRKA